MFKILKGYFFIVLLSVVFSIYFFEAYLISKEHNLEKLAKEIKKRSLEDSKNYDVRTEKEYFEFLKKKDDKVSITYFPNNFLNTNLGIRPLSGISNSLTLNCNENGYYSVYSSDRFGFNNPDTEWESNNLEYLLVGDSFTLGNCVNRPDDIASNLRKLSNKNVLNLGYAANGPLLEFVTLREYLSPKVKNVLWLYFEGNDLLDFNNELTDDILKKYLEDENFTQNLTSKQSEIDELIKKRILPTIDYRNNLLKKNNLKYKILKFIRLDKTKTIFKQIKNKYKKDEFISLIQKTNILVEKNNSKLYFVYLPDYKRYESNLFFKRYNNNNYEFIKDSMIKLNIPFIDLHESVFKKDDPKSLFPFRISAHYNEIGYKKVSQHIFEFTNNN